MLRPQLSYSRTAVLLYEPSTTAQASMDTWIHGQQPFSEWPFGGVKVKHQRLRGVEGTRNSIASTAIASLAVVGSATLAACGGSDGECPSGSELREAFYNDSARDRVARGLNSSGVYGPTAVRELTDDLDRYADRWADLRRSVCERRLPAPALSQANACFESAAARFHHSARVLSLGAPGQVLSGHRLVASLDPLQRCNSSPALENAARAAMESGDATTVASVRASISEVEVLLEVGLVDSASRRLEAVKLAAGTIDRPLLQARVDWAAGSVALAQGSTEDARASLLRAALTAQAHNDVVLLVATLVDLGDLEASGVSGVEAAKRWLGFAEASARRLTPEDPLHAWLALSLARVDRVSGLPERALERLENMFDADKIELGHWGQADESIRANTQRLRAQLLRDMGQLTQAHATYEGLLKSTRSRYGEHHPDVAAILLDLAVLHSDANELPKAAEWAKSSLSSAENVYPADSVRLVPHLTTLAEVDLAAGNPRSALELVSRAWRLERDGHLKPEAVDGEALELLTEVEATLGRTARAVKGLIELAEIWKHDSRRPQVDLKIARHACMSGHCSGARSYIDRLLDLSPIDEQLRLHQRLFLAWEDLQGGDLQRAERELKRIENVLAMTDTSAEAELRADLSAVAALVQIDSGASRAEWEPTLADAQRLYDRLRSQPGGTAFVAMQEALLRRSCVDKIDSSEAIARLLLAFDANIDEDTIRFSGGDHASPDPRVFETPERPAPNGTNWKNLQCLLRHQGRTMLHAMTSFTHPEPAHDVESHIARATVLIVGQGEAAMGDTGRLELTDLERLSDRLGLCPGPMQARELGEYLVPGEDESCTGLLVGRNAVLTLRHCINGIRGPGFVVFNYRTPGAGAAVVRKVDYVYCGDENGGTDHDCAVVADESFLDPLGRKSRCGSGPFATVYDGGVDDWALLIFEDDGKSAPVGQPVSRRELGEKQPADNDASELVSLGHPRGMPLLVSPRSTVIAKPRDAKPHNILVETSIRGATGSSGSPVYDRDAQVVVGLVARISNTEFYDCPSRKCYNVIRCTVAEGCGTSLFYPVVPLVERLCSQSGFNGEPDLSICDQSAKEVEK